jgi:hypothetical protein
MQMNSKQKLGMKSIAVIMVLLFTISPTLIFAHALYQTTETPVPSETPVPATTLTPTNIPTLSDAQISATETAIVLTQAAQTLVAQTQRPMLTLREYSISEGTAYSGNTIVVKANIRNNGSANATNVRVQFTSGDFVPLQNGGLQVHNNIAVDNGITVEQDMQVAYGVWGSSSQSITVTYTSPTGQEYTDTFVLYFNGTGGSGGSAATSTPTIMPRPNLIVSAYNTDIGDLQAGNIFDLQLDIQNQGNSLAENVMLVLGGSVTAASGDNPGGDLVVNTDDFKYFAPLGSSNIHNLGNLAPGASMQFDQKLVVNTTTEPGAYPLEITFVYDDKNGNRVMDHQIVTLLIYALPKISASFYREVGTVFTEQDTMLPIQITNTGKKSVVLGEIKITCDGALITNGTSTVGAMDSGGYFTIDPTALFATPGTYQIDLLIKYTDDFNTERQIEQSLQLDVEAIPQMESDPALEGMQGPDMPAPEMLQETFIQKVGRFLKGFFGLGSAL